MEPTELPRVLAIEHPIPTVPDRTLGGYAKRPFAYEESAERLARTKYKRHLYPSEGGRTLLDAKHPAAEDMRRGIGEWYNLAWVLRDGILTLHSDPENLCSSADSYAVIGGRILSSGERTFGLGDLPPSARLPLRDIERRDPGLVEYLWGASFDALPAEVQRDGYVILPPEGEVMPLGRGAEWYGIDSLGKKASRGVCLERLMPKSFRASVPVRSELGAHAYA